MAVEEADTLPFNVIDQPAPWDPSTWDANGDGDVSPEEVRKRIPEPAVARGVITTAVGVVSYIVGKQLNLDWIDEAVLAYGALAPFLLSLWIRRNVSPAKK